MHHIIDEKVLDGFYRLSEDLPDMDLELYAVCSVKNDRRQRRPSAHITYHGGRVFFVVIGFTAVQGLPAGALCSLIFWTSLSMLFVKRPLADRPFT